MGLRCSLLSPFANLPLSVTTLQALETLFGVASLQVNTVEFKLLLVDLCIAQCILCNNVRGEDDMQELLSFYISMDRVPGNKIK